MVRGKLHFRSSGLVSPPMQIVYQQFGKSEHYAPGAGAAISFWQSYQFFFSY